MKNDYPFKNWNDFYNALTDYLIIGSNSSTDIYEYPEYARHQSYNNTIDIQIISELLDSGLSPQEGLDGFIDTIIYGMSNGASIVDDMGYDYPTILKMFIDKGAVPKLDVLFTRTYKSERVTFEDEVNNYSTRGCLIDALAKAYPGLDLSKYADWKSIKATYLTDFDKDLQRGYDWDEKHRMMYLKHSSWHIQEIYV
jgi:hypothetical protein